MQIHKQSLISLTKVLRTNQTSWEHKLWYHLRGGRFFGLKFKRQVMIGEYIADFCCNEKKLIIEVDGSQHGEQQTKSKDEERDKYFQLHGYVVLRFWNNEIDDNLQGVLEIIKRSVDGQGSTSL